MMQSNPELIKQAQANMQSGAGGAGFMPPAAATPATTP